MSCLRSMMFWLLNGSEINMSIGIAHSQCCEKRWGSEDEDLRKLWQRMVTSFLEDLESTS